MKYWAVSVEGAMIGHIQEPTLERAIARAKIMCYRPGPYYRPEDWPQPQWTVEPITEVDAFAWSRIHGQG